MVKSVGFLLVSYPNWYSLQSTNEASESPPHHSLPGLSFTLPWFSPAYCWFLDQVLSSWVKIMDPNSVPPLVGPRFQQRFLASFSLGFFLPLLLARRGWPFREPRVSAFFLSFACSNYWSCPSSELSTFPPSFPVVHSVLRPLTLRPLSFEGNDYSTPSASSA